MEKIGLLQKEPLCMHDLYYEAQFAILANDLELADAFIYDLAEQMDITPVKYPGVYRLNQEMFRDAVLGIVHKVLAVGMI